MRRWEGEEGEEKGREEGREERRRGCRKKTWRHGGWRVEVF